MEVTGLESFLEFKTLNSARLPSVFHQILDSQVAESYIHLTNTRGCRECLNLVYSCLTKLHIASQLLKEVSLGSLLPPNQIRLLEATFLSNEVVSPAPEPGQGRGRKAAEGRLGDRLDVGKELNRAGQWAPGCPDLPVLPAQNSVQELMARALELESQRWAQDVAPQRLDGHCHSELAIDIIQVA